MNICLLNDSFPPVIDGVANVVMNYADIMTRELESNVIVGTPRYPGVSYDGYPYQVIPYPSFDTTDFVKGYRTGNPLSIKEIKQMTDFKPDIIHTHCPAASTVMARILRRETARKHRLDMEGVSGSNIVGDSEFGMAPPVIFSYHTKFDVDIERAVGDGLLKKETIKAMIANIEACDEVWVVSEGAGDNLRSLGYEGKLRVMENGVDFPKGRASQQLVKELNSAYDIPEGIPLFLFVGRIMKYKGLPIIVDAINELSEAGIDYRMVFVGGGADATEMQEKIRNYGIALDIYDEDSNLQHTDASAKKSGKAIFTGPEHDREKLRAWNTRADLFLFPSTYDTNGIVVREAAACGLASVLIKGSCAAEGITDGRNGFLIEENAHSMAALLKEVHSDLDHLHQAGQCAMDEIYISWDSSVRKAFSRYKEIIELKKSGELGDRKHESFENLMRSAEIALDGTQRAFFANVERSVKDNIYELKAFHQGMLDNFDELRSDFTNGFGKLQDNIKEGLTEIKEKIHENTNRW